MTTYAIFLQHPGGLCFETDTNVEDLLFDEYGGDFIRVRRIRDNATVIIPVSNIADVVIGGDE